MHQIDIKYCSVICNLYNVYGIYNIYVFVKFAMKLSKNEFDQNLDNQSLSLWHVTCHTDYEDKPLLHHINSHLTLKNSHIQMVGR